MNDQGRQLAENKIEYHKQEAARLRKALQQIAQYRVWTDTGMQEVGYETAIDHLQELARAALEGEDDA